MQTSGLVDFPFYKFTSVVLFGYFKYGAIIAGFFSVDVHVFVRFTELHSGHVNLFCVVFFTEV